MKVVSVDRAETASDVANEPAPLSSNYAVCTLHKSALSDTVYAVDHATSVFQLGFFTVITH